MTWKSHIAIATAVTIPFNPVGVLPAIIGSTATDWSEYVLKMLGFSIQHRGVTHLWLIPVFIIALSFIWDYNSFIFWFGVGYLTHIFADSLTISGVPCVLTPHKIHFFGGKFRTGNIGEYLFSFGLLAFMIWFFGVGAFASNSIFNEPQREFNPYMMNYKELNEKGIIDNKEYLEKRFKFF